MKYALFLILTLGVFGLPLFGAETTGETTETGVSKYVTPINGAVEIVYAPINYHSYQWTDSGTQAHKLNGFRLNFEWIPFGDVPYGKPVFGVGTGFSWISNAGLHNGSNSNLYILPVEPYLGYRADIFRNQILVPYGKIGLGYAHIKEENKGAESSTRYSSYLGFDLAAGAEFWLNFIDSKSAKNLDSSTGINNVYLLVEYFKSKDLGAQYANLSREELRLGMRFEF